MAVSVTFAIVITVLVLLCCVLTKVSVLMKHGALSVPPNN